LQARWFWHRIVSMEILPAIDLRDGKCVRLIQGQYDKEIIYEESPLRQAQTFIAQGAGWLHLVDLDGAREGRRVNSDVIQTLAQLKGLRIELGGGIRDEESIRGMLDLGMERVIVGTRAVSDFEWFGQMAHKFPSRVALGLDARGAKIATHGWHADSGQDAVEFARKAAALPIAAIIYTDIARDGMLSGPNFERTKAVIDAVDKPVIASGGVTTLEDVRKCAAIGAAGAIIGRAYYEGSIDIGAAIAAARQK
jgi:phosphoribosylformimino-5-aminoimidazole carboxamide ribotide isomerase